MNFIDHLQNERKLRIETWQKVKEDWKPAIMDEHYLTDDDKRIIAGKINGVNAIIGYYHFGYEEGNELFADGLVSHINALSREITRLVVSNKWFPVTMSIITTYKLSSFPHVDLDKLDISGKMFGFLNTYPNYDKKNFKLQKDDTLFQRIEVDILMKKIKETGK